MDKSACVGKDLEQFFPETKREMADAKEFCEKHCSVRLKCLAFVMAKEKPKEEGQKTYRFGMYGGLNPKEREALQKVLDEQTKKKDGTND
jgi:hypothetical protein